MSVLPVAIAEVSGTRTAYEIAGSGPPLLLLHGAEGTRRSFDKLTGELESAFTVIRYDQRDCGETQNDDTPASLPILADDAKALLDALGYAKAFVFGTSFGGRVAQALAILHPEVVERLILSSTWALPDSLLTLNRDTTMKVMGLRDRLPETAEQLAEYFYPPAFLQERPEFKGHFGKSVARSERSARRAETTNDTPPLKPSDITAPTLLIAGELDRLVPPSLTLAIGNAVDSSESVVLPGLGHVGYVQAPALVAPHIRKFCLKTSSRC